MATPNLVTFSDWQQKTNAGLMSAAEELLEKLEDTSDLLAEIDEKYIRTDPDAAVEGDDRKCSMIQRFHAGLDSARNLVNVLKREKWRLSKREMSVELRMGELEDYKSHLKNDMSSLNQTVEALSLRLVQLENQLVEAQETQENLEAELREHKNSLQDANDRNIQLYTENEDLKRQVASLGKSNVQRENQMLKDEVSVLSQENSKLKDMVRDAEALASPVLLKKLASPESRSPPSPAGGAIASGAAGELPPASPGAERNKEDNLSKMTKEFLDELTSLELREERDGGDCGLGSGGGGVGFREKSGGLSSFSSSSFSSSSSSTKKVPSADV